MYIILIILLFTSFGYSQSEKITIAFVPLDDRPVCYTLPKKLGNISSFRLLTPPPSAVGFYGIYGNPEKVIEFLKKNVSRYQYLILSIDMLCYGGLIASREDKTKLEVALNRLQILKELKNSNPALKIYAFSVIQRLAPTYTGDEKKNRLNNLLVEYLKIKYESDKTSNEIERLKRIEEGLPKEFIETYLKIRERNHLVNFKTVELVNEGIINYLVLPLDDTAKSGPHIEEIKRIKEFIREQVIITKVSIYPGADEVGMELLSKVVTELTNKKPRFFIRYAATYAPYLIQPLEDRTLGEVIKSHITACGGIIVDTPEDADIILFVNSSGELLYKRDSDERNLSEFVEAIKYYFKKDKLIAIADIATLNKADIDLVNVLLEEVKLPSLTAYAGWNTPSNSLGCAISQSIIFFCSKKDITAKLNNIEFLFQRFADEYLYLAKLKPKVDKKVKEYGTHPLYITQNYVEIRNFIREGLTNSAKKLFEKHFKGYILGKNNVGKFIIIEDMSIRVNIPWLRTFEVSIDVKFFCKAL